jgi:hypothetical protein
MYHCFSACHRILDLNWNVQKQPSIQYKMLIIGTDLYEVTTIRMNLMGELVLNFLRTMFKYLFALCASILSISLQLFWGALLIHWPTNGQQAMFDS